MSDDNFGSILSSSIVLYHILNYHDCQCFEEKISLKNAGS
jgi:hypothetical protein